MKQFENKNLSFLFGKKCLKSFKKTNLVCFNYYYKIFLIITLIVHTRISSIRRKRVNFKKNNKFFCLFYV